MQSFPAVFSLVVPTLHGLSCNAHFIAAGLRRDLISDVAASGPDRHQGPV